MLLFHSCYGSAGRKCRGAEEGKGLLGLVQSLDLVVPRSLADRMKTRVSVSRRLLETLYRAGSMVMVDS